MKRIISMILTATTFAAVSSVAIAADNNPQVYVDGAKIYFADQEATIIDNRTLVPARGVFEAMGAEVNWDGTTKVVTINTADSKSSISLTINDNIMKVNNTGAKSKTSAASKNTSDNETTIELDVAPQIVNDRTMIPLRAISEAMDATVDWNSSEYLVNIVTKNALTPDQKADLPTYTLSTETKKINADETVDLFVNVANIPENNFVSNVTATLTYDKENFEFVNAALVDSEGKDLEAYGADNSTFEDNNLKVSYVTIDANTAVKSDGKVMKITFKSITGKRGEFSLSNGYNTKVRFNTFLVLNSLRNTKVATTFEGNSLNVDTTPVVIN